MFGAKPKASFRPYQTPEPQPWGAVTLLQLGNARLIIRVDELDLPPDFLGYEVAACPSLSLCAHLLDFLRLQSLHSI